MRNKGWTLSIIVLASLAFVAIALALVAQPADATITGKPLPPYGNDWVIDQDTTVLGESIKLQGNITIEGGNTLKVRNTEIKINSTYQGEHGIYIATNSTTGDGALELDDCTFRSDYAANGWYFEVWGGLKIVKARLYNVENGLQIYSDKVDVLNMTLHAQGYYGLYIYQADPKIHASEIYAMGYEGIVVTGIKIEGNSSKRAAPDLDDLYVKVYRNDDIFSESSYTYIYFNLVGVDCYYGQFNKLSNIEVTFEATADVWANYSFNPTVRVYYYVTGYVFHGGTVLGGLDVNIGPSTYYVNADSDAAAGNLHMYNYFRGLQNFIGSDGKSPDIFSGFEAKGQMMDWNTNQVFNEKLYYRGRGFEWYPSHGAATADTITVDGVVLDGIEVENLIGIDSLKKHVFRNNQFNNNYIYYRLMDYWFMPNDVLWTNNEIINNTMDRSEFFRLYMCDGAFTFRGNDMSYNTYSRLFYAYANFEDMVFEDNVFIGNTGTYALFYIDQTQSPVEFTGNVWDTNTFQYFLYTSYPDYAFEFVENTWINNSGTSWAFYMRYAQGSANLDFEDNILINNTFNGFLYSYYQNSLWTLDGNTFEGNAFGQRGVLWLYGYLQGGGYDITDNEFINNTGAGSYFKFYGLGYWGDRDFTFERNKFTNNTATTSSTGGLIYFYMTRQDFSVRDCEFNNNSANCIVVYWTYQYYTSVYSSNMFFDDNLFYNNTGKGIVLSETGDDYVTIRGNNGAGNEDYCVWIDHSKGYQYKSTEADHAGISYSYGIPRGPKELIIEANNFSYNPGGGIWAGVSQYSSQYTYYNPGQPNAEIRIKKNMLYGNGPDGWSLGMDNLYRKPTVKSNFLKGSSMGEFWGMITEEDVRAQRFDVAIRDVYLDGGPEGKTAYGFSNIDAEFYDCMFVNFSVCLYASDCEVNVFWSGVPEASGETAGDGAIYVWNHLEIWVTWANATGVDSGIPTPGTIVAMQGANGNYFGALLTDSEGKLFDVEGDPMVINPWTCEKGVMDAWSPFTITLLARENVSTAHQVSIVEDFIDPNPLRLTLNDVFIPEVIIANPQDDTLVDEADVLTEGFLFEIGSGIVLFEGRNDMMPEDEWVVITRNVLWQHVFHGMTEGYHNISVRAADLSGNWNTSNIEIIVDLTDPDLFVKLEYLNATEIPYDPVKGGYFVREKKIVINGTYDDNYAHVGDIIIRINGKAIYIFPSRWGFIYTDIELAQGINTLIVDATDTAGNRIGKRLYVSMDSYPPTMYIYNPLDNQMTANETLMVTGLTEPRTRLDMIVQASAGTNTYRTSSLSDGTFMFPVTLFEGIQKVLVTAIDSAGNPTLIDLNVILDTTPPDFIIERPSEGYEVTSETRYLITGTMTIEPDARVFIGGQEVIHSGVFQREVVLQEGENIIDIIAIDKVDNRKTKYVTIIRDTVPPVLEVMAPEGDYMITNISIISFHGFVEGSMAVFIKHKTIEFPAELLDGTWENGEWKYDLELGPQDLEQDITVIARDLAKNEDTMSIHVVYDIVPPSLQIDPAPEEVETPFVWINGSTDESIPFVTVQGVPYSVISGVFEIQWSLAAGENNLQVEVMDEAGNRAKDNVLVTYTRPTPPIKPDDSEDELDILGIAGISILLVAIVVLVTALFVVYSRRRRR